MTPLCFFVTLALQLALLGLASINYQHQALWLVYIDSIMQSFWVQQIRVSVRARAKHDSAFFVTLALLLALVDSLIRCLYRFQALRLVKLVRKYNHSPFKNQGECESETRLCFFLHYCAPTRTGNIDFEKVNVLEKQTSHFLQKRISLIPSICTGMNESKPFINCRIRIPYNFVHCFLLAPD